MRESWHSRQAFVLATIGSAIGLGNVWRFPYICYKYGGGAFLVPYFIALFTVGIPLMVLEFAIGHKMRKGAPNSFQTVSKNKEWIGWFALLIAFGILSYYAVIMGWCLNYIKYSFTLEWGKDTQDFFFNHFLKLSNQPYEVGKLNLGIVLALIVTWVAIIGCVWKGPKTVGKVVYVTVILPWIILLIFVVRGLTLPGAIKGISYYLTPNFSALKNLEVWRSAYSQIFFSLSIGFGILIAYSSYLPEKRDIVNNAFIVSLANCGTSFLAGIAVFSTLGYYSYVEKLGIEEVVKSSVPLAFITYPTIINLLPFGSKVFGFLFFTMLFALGIDSAFSLVEATTTGIIDKWNLSGRRKIINISFGGVGVLVGLFYTTKAGLYWLDIIDHFMNYGLIIVGFVEAIVLGYFFKLKILKDHCNSISEIKVGKWWEFCVKVLTPAVLGVLIITQLIERIKTPYGGYTRGAECWGWIVLVVFLFGAILLMWKNRK